MHLQIWAVWFYHISYFFLGESLAMSKFFSEMNLQLINIVGETATQIWWIFSHLLAVLREKYGPITNFFCKSISEFPGSSENVGM